MPKILLIDGEWEFDSVYIEFSGLRNTEFHKHIEVPIDAETGDYHFHFSVTDMEGSQTVFEDEVEILWDKWGIPHIFAKSIEDAYFTQGYVHARHRLWQMEQFRRLTSGRLSEISGEVTLDMDKHYKSIGLNRIAKTCSDRLKKESENEQLHLLESYINLNKYPRPEGPVFG